MEITTLAGSTVSRVGLGTWAMGGSEWGAVSEADGVATCLTALYSGINFFDTAPIYGHGRAEQILASAIRQQGRRDAFFIATKAGLEWNDRGVFANSTPQRLRQELEDSLRRLGTDYIDLYQVHWPDTLEPIEDVARLFAEFVTEGKVRAIGVSNFSVEQMEAFRSVASLSSNQPPYNLFERAIDREVLPWCAQNGVGVITYSSLCRSLLGGRLRRGMTFAEGDIRTADPKFQRPRFDGYMTAVERLTLLARDKFSKTLPQLAVRWVLDQPGVSIALWGAKHPDQLDPVSGVKGWRLDAETLAEIDRILIESIPDPVGPEYLTPRVRET